MKEVQTGGLRVCIADIHCGNFMKEQDADGPIWLIDFGRVNLLPPSFFFFALSMPQGHLAATLRKIIASDEDVQRNVRLMSYIFGYWVVRGADTSIGKLRAQDSIYVTNRTFKPDLGLGLPEALKKKLPSRS